MIDGGNNKIRINLREALFLTECPVCGRIIESGALCEACDAALENARLNKNVFELENDLGEPVLCCGSFLYKSDVVRKLLFYFKQRINKSAVNYAAMKMLRDIPDLGICGNVVFSNVPRGRENVRRYGYDQSALIAKRLAKLYSGCGVYRPLLTRLFFTKEQKRLNKSERETNLKNKLYVGGLKKFLAGRPQNIVVVDDVITTGTSAAESARALKKAFPDANVYAAFFAVRTPR